MKTIWGKVLIFTFLFTLGKSNLICSNSENSSQEDLSESNDSSESENSSENETSTLKERLSDYKIVNPTRRTNFNFAFIRNMQSFNLDVNFQNSYGDTKKRKYNLKFYSYGLKAELALKINFIVVSGGELNFHNTNKEIELGVGVDIQTLLFDVTYIPFKNMPGSIKIFSIPITNYIYVAGKLLNLSRIDLGKTISIDDILEAIIQNANRLLSSHYDYYKKNLLYTAFPLIGAGPNIVTNGYLTPVELL